MGSAFRVVPSVLASGFLTLACFGCETTAQKSTELEKLAKHEKLALRGVSVTRESPSVKVLGSAVVHTSEGTAVVVTVRNTSSHTLENAPIEITVRDAKGSVLFQNNQPGEDPSLTHVSVLTPGIQTVWVDDQVQVTSTPASASALVGEAAQASGNAPAMSASGAHVSDEGGERGETGMVANRSQVAQQHVAVYAVASRSGRIVAAGRAVLPEVAPGTSVPFQLYFIGDPTGASVKTSVAATTF